MASIGNQGRGGGQRGNMSSRSGRKQRSQTRSPHSGSRVDPSHTLQKARTDRDKKFASRASAAAKKAAKRG